MSLVYKEGPLNAEEPVDLTGYQLRMDIVNATNNARLYTFNSEEIDDVDPTTPGDQPDAETEAVLQNDGTIKIAVPRGLTLGNGAVATLLAGNESALLNYDIFLRNPDGLQSKILRGVITVERSYTKWA